MRGAIIGDIVGSVYEWHNIKTKEFPLFSPDCFFTDDTVMTCAVAYAVQSADRGGHLDDLDYFRNRGVEWMQFFGREYEGRGYGLRFLDWLYSDDPKPYGSTGNGSAMRVSPVAWVARTRQECIALATASADVTHNDPEGIKGAVATALAVYLAKEGKSVQQIRHCLTKNYYPELAGMTVDGIRPTYTFHGSCMRSVPQAIACALEATSFEDAIRNAISIGGDSDTIAAIAGSIAEPLFGIPPDLWATCTDVMRRTGGEDLLEIDKDFSVYKRNYCHYLMWTRD